MQDVIDRVKIAEQRAHDAEQRLQAQERDAAAIVTRVAVLETRYSDLKQSLDGVVKTQAVQGERLSSLGEKSDGISARIEVVRDDIRVITNRVWAGSAAGAGGTGLVALIAWFLTQRGGAL